MAEIIISETQLTKIEKLISSQKNLELANENWSKFSQEEKDAIVEWLKVIYPENAKLIKESTWLNTLGDIVGIFDPTGVVDLVNGISYIYQGDNLFGFLSLISAVPYIGDVVAKPVMGALKIGAPSAKALNKVMSLSKAGKSTEAAELLAKLTQQGGITGKFVEGFGKVAGKLRGYIERAPIGIFKGFKKTILQWFDLFENAAKTGRTVRYAGGTLAKRLPKLSPVKQLEQLEIFKKMASSSNVFRSYRTTKGVMSWKTLFRGMPQLIGRNASVRALARQTKWWAGFLDYMGLGNFVGPEEISKKMGEENFINKMEEYQKTPEAQQNFSDDFGSETTDNSSVESKPTTTTPSSSGTEDKSGQDPLSKFLKNLFVGQLNPLPGV
jgi:hypothetical protein